MAFEAISHQSSRPPVPATWADVENLVTEDDTPVDNFFSEKQRRLLTRCLFTSPHWAQGRKFIAVADVGLFYSLGRPALVPDVMLALDVQAPEDPWPKLHRSYFVSEFGKPPDVVIEIVSNREGGEDSDKLIGYAEAGVGYYVIYDPGTFLGDQPLRVYRLEGAEYRRLHEPWRLSGLQLGLSIWKGRFENWDEDWLRWTDAEGALLLTGEERAERQRLRAERLAEQLRRAGLEPEA